MQGHTQTHPQLNILAPLTTQSSSLRYVSAAEHQTAEQYSKTGKTKPLKGFDSCRSKLVNIVSECFLAPLLFLLYTSELFSILENKLIGYADDSTLIAVVPSPGLRVALAESLSHDLMKASEWCDLMLVRQRL